MLSPPPPSFCGLGAEGGVVGLSSGGRFGNDANNEGQGSEDHGPSPGGGRKEGGRVDGLALPEALRFHPPTSDDTQQAGAHRVTEQGEDCRILGAAKERVGTGRKKGK